MTIMIKKIILVSLLSEFLIFANMIGFHDCEIEGKHQHPHHVEPPERVILRRLTRRNEVEISVELNKMSETYLANENLPIWIAHGANPDKLSSATHVMDDIGPFFTYQDTKSCSAAVYFAKRNYFDGTIANRYSMYHIPYDPRTKQMKPSNYNMLPVDYTHDKQISDVSNDTPERTGIHESPELLVEMNKWKFVQSRLPLPDAVYVETLVIVNYDMLKSLEDISSLVSYILVTFNSVDMLYSKIDKPKIKINIAGVIIGDSRESFPEIAQSCYEKYDDEEGVNSACVTAAVKKLLGVYKQRIPMEIYDVVVFLTNFESHGYHQVDGQIVPIPLDGYAETPEDGTYDGFRLSSQQTRVALVINYEDEFQSFATIAHELAHLLNVYHDQGEFRNPNGECKANLMRTDGSFCEKCLFFSSSSQAELKRFFSSRDGCIFHNLPRSLYEPKSAPQLFWSDDQQCQCYGFYYAYNCHTSIWEYVKKLWKGEIDCKERLKCVPAGSSPRSRIADTAYFMPGTPCNEQNGVCWNGKCTSIVTRNLF